jgi:hypothetical protein
LRLDYKFWSPRDVGNIECHQSIAVASDKAWEAIAAIGGLDRWFPVISTCRVEGAGVGVIRILALTNGAEMRDRVSEINSCAKRFRYERTRSPFPVTKYVGAVEVKDGAGPGTQLSWTVQIEVEEEAREQLVAFLEQALSDGINGLECDLR